MHDNQRSIEGQCIIKAVARTMNALPLSSYAEEEIKETIGDLFDLYAAKLDAYAKLDTPLNAPGASRNDVHLSDEQVARGIAREADKPFPEGLDTAPLKDATGLIQSTSRKEYKPGKYMYGIKVEGVWHTAFQKIHYDLAEEARGEGRTVRVLYDPTPCKGKASRTVQSVDIL